MNCIIFTIIFMVCFAFGYLYIGPKIGEWTGWY